MQRQNIFIQDFSYKYMLSVLLTIYGLPLFLEVKREHSNTILNKTGFLAGTTAFETNISYTLIGRISRTY